MTKQQAIDFFGNQKALAHALGIAQPSVAGWKDVPAIRQLQLEVLTKGKLRADKSLGIRVHIPCA